jgi:chorismate synthase
MLERSSARETASRTAAGAVARKFLSFFNIRLYSHVLSIAACNLVGRNPRDEKALRRADRRPLRCLERKNEAEAMRDIDLAAKQGESLGGIFEVVVKGVPVGLGSYASWQSRLDASLARSLMSIPAVKGVEVGMGFGASLRPGSAVHDEIFYQGGAFTRGTNRAGGIEGGISNGEDIILRGAMKPLPTLGRPLKTVNVRTKKAVTAHKERRDVCAVPAAGVVAEAMVALDLAREMLLKFGGDCLEDSLANYRTYLKRLNVY